MSKPELLPFEVKGRREFELVSNSLGLKYFTYEELCCPCCQELTTTVPFLVTLLRIRERYKRPMSVTSAYRCRRHNEAVGGAKDSAHLKGLALDVAIKDSKSRFLFIEALLQEGVRRIGLYPSHVHFDLDFEKPDRVLWLG